LGGYSSTGSLLKTVEVFNPATDAWTSSTVSGTACASAMLACMPTPRYHFAAATAPCHGSSDTCVYAVGGLDSFGDSLKTFEAYDTSTNTWTSSDSGGSCASTSIDCMPTARYLLAAASAPCPASTDTCVYAVGGFGPGGIIKTVEAYDPTTNIWTSSTVSGSYCSSTVIACMPTARDQLAAVSDTCPGSTDTCLYALDGFDDPDAMIEAYKPAAPTAAYTTGLWLRHSANRLLCRWKLVDGRDIAGFDIISGGHKLNRRLILARHATGVYWFSRRWQGTGRVELITVFRDGRQTDRVFA
jgi:hypothetical protein